MISSYTKIDSLASFSKIVQSESVYFATLDFGYFWPNPMFSSNFENADDIWLVLTKWWMQVKLEQSYVSFSY